MTVNSVERLYKGDGQFHYADLPKIDGRWERQEPYIARTPLVEAVRAALYLRRPLLLEGEPGCGKTRLAYAVAYELGYPLYTCYINSNTRAQDLLYEYDALRRLYDLEEIKVKGNEIQPKPRREYVILGKLGEAIARSAIDNTPSVVLIDEIDKADLDFPNDLLEELDRLKFEVKEVKEETMGFDAFQNQSLKERRNYLPLIIITSNREKELPKPFLRRCLYYYIDFPKETMKSIIQSHQDEFIDSPVQSEGKPLELTPLFEAALKKFWNLREQQFWRKIVGTSELLDWLKMLEKSGIKHDELEGKTLSKLPHLETLIKTQSDHDSLVRLTE